MIMKIWYLGSGNGGVSVVDRGGESGGDMAIPEIWYLGSGNGGVSVVDRSGESGGDMVGLSSKWEPFGSPIREDSLLVMRIENSDFMPELPAAHRALEQLLREAWLVGHVGLCYADEPLAVPLDGLHFDDKLQFVEEPVEIMDREVKRLKRSRIPLVKVRWNSKRGPEFTWEREDQFKKKYPHLFTKTAPSSSAAS
ncbi:hypothetical protein Tco_0209692 [Tanacetum coccineum]